MSLILTWKDKILDYEIETICREYTMSHYQALEKIRFSITRLKPCSTKELIYKVVLVTWKDKILDYEIETR